MEEFNEQNPVEQSTTDSELQNNQELTEIKQEKEVNDIFEDIGERVNSADKITRREFLLRLKEMAVVGGLGFVLSACNIKPEELAEAANTNESEYKPPSQSTEKPLEGIEKDYSERGFTLVKDPYRVNTQELIVGDRGYSTAITEKFEFPDIDGSGKKYPLIYGKEFEEVTFMHYTGQKPPVTGEIVPLIYKLPPEAQSKDIEISPYAISVPGNMPKRVNFNENSEYYLIPIVTSGSNSGITPTTYEGNIVNSTYPSIEVIPDSVSQNPNGFLSWALLTKENGSLIMEGVINNTSAKLFIDYKDVPDEIYFLYVKE